MSAYRKFSDVRQTQVSAPGPSKPAKAPKLDPIEAETLGGLGALGEAEPQIRNSAPLVWSADCALATWGEAERAAIIEHDGDILRGWAEGFARLDPDRPPGNVPLRRWQRFVDDAGLFLDSPFCAVAAALGWGPHDLFGCDRDRPFARIDQAGLLWLLNGDTLVEINRHTAIIERRTGVRQIFRRRPVAVGEVVLAWELVPERPNVVAEV
jgi:hypothetical protein